MKKILLIYLLALTTGISYSQKSFELKELKEELEFQKTEVEKQLTLLNKKIDSLNIEINFQIVKENAIPTILKRSSLLYEKPSKYSNIIKKLKSKSKVLIVKYYEYGGYFRAIHNDEIGYINEKDIKLTKNIKNLKKTNKYYSNSSNNKSSFQNNSKKQNFKRTYTSRRYYRGPRGGCYYINSNGNKTYVSRSLCN